MKVVIICPNYCLITSHSFSVAESSLVTGRKLDHKVESVRSKEKFDEQNFMFRLETLKGKKSEIEKTVQYCIKKKSEGYKLARCWRKIITEAESIEKKKTLLYLVSDIVQASRKYNITGMIEKFKNAIDECIPFCGIEKTFLKVLEIWSKVHVFPSRTILRWRHQFDLTTTEILITQDSRESSGGVADSDAASESSESFVSVNEKEHIGAGTSKHNEESEDGRSNLIDGNVVEEVCEIQAKLPREKTNFIGNNDLEWLN